MNMFSGYNQLGQLRSHTTQAPSAMIGPQTRGGSVMRHAPSSMIAPGRSSVLGVNRPAPHVSVAPVRR